MLPVHGRVVAAAALLLLLRPFAVLAAEPDTSEQARSAHWQECADLATHGYRDAAIACWGGQPRKQAPSSGSGGSWFGFVQSVGAALQQVPGPRAIHVEPPPQSARPLQPPEVPDVGEFYYHAYRPETPPHGCIGQTPVAGPGLNPCSGTPSR